MLKEKIKMKDKRFDGIMIPVDRVSPELLRIISLVANKEYGTALQMAEEEIANAKNSDAKNIATMISLQILAFAGYTEMASILLEALLANFEASCEVNCRAKSLCQRTINCL